jgi:aspartate/tyrosine/aromatic aminotransferase
MSFEFGEQVYAQAKQLAEEGKDANQTAKILCDNDPEGCNYGIGIMLGGDGKPMATSPTLLQYVTEELSNSGSGTYMNSAKTMGILKQAVMKWQRIPEKYWDGFILVVPSDAGTGAVKTGIEAAIGLNPKLKVLGVEELGWPAYKAIAKTARLEHKEYPGEAAIQGEELLPVYQSGPMNTTGQVKSIETILERARVAAQKGDIVILDRAYSGFEFARLVKDSSIDEIMTRSYELQIKPFIDAGVTFCMALSPTKAFVTFSLRPGGILLLYCPDSTQKAGNTAIVNTVMRARGSSFEHPVTRAFVKAMVGNLAGLEEEQKASLTRLAEAEAMWRKLVAGTPIEYLFAEDYAGLFRNPKANDNAALKIYNEHIYPVFATKRCRMNVTGIPSNEVVAENHVKVFTQECF